MTSSSAARVGADGEPATRPRPQVHFTARRGWINDPYGVTWAGDRYHVFYQYVPHQTTWSPRCWWGHADSPDLVHWTERDPALVPQPHETGCWSGSAALDDDGPRLFYTRVTDDLTHGAIAAAVGDRSFGDWRAHRDPVIAHAPAELEVTAFRDPYVFRHGDRWHLLAGAGLPGARGAVLQYHSSDLRTWVYDGVLCTGGECAEWSGSVWECPQLVPVGDEHLLLVSVWDRGLTHHVLAGLGRYDGLTFVPRVWRRLTFGNSAYATSAFVDAQGRPSVISWLREEPPDQPDLPERAGALSVPAVVGAGTDGPVLAPHPNLLANATLVSIPESGQDASIGTDGRAAYLRLPTPPGLEVELRSGGTPVAVLSVEGSSLVVERVILGTETMPVGGDLEIIVDADVVEVFSAVGYGAFRMRNMTGPATIVVRGPRPDAAYALLT